MALTNNQNHQNNNPMTTTDNHKKHHPFKSFLVDTVAGLSAATLVSPFVAIVDKSIVSHASGRQHMKEGIKIGLQGLLRSPFKFIQQRFVIYVWGVYAGTYLTANWIETAFKLMEQDFQLPKFIGTSIVNMILCVKKDEVFTKMFALDKRNKTTQIVAGNSTHASSMNHNIHKTPAFSPRPVPFFTKTLFRIRDSMTIAASFTIPPLLSPLVQEGLACSKATADNLVQLSIPCAVQFCSTPLHLWALDYYNNPGNSVHQRTQFVQREYTKSVFARIGRIFPAFGIGGVSNRMIRESLSS